VRADVVTLLRAHGLPAPEREYRFDPARRWRFDYAWPAQKVALEREGGTWAGGRHVRPKGYENDCKKYNRAQILGWLVVRATAGMVASGEAAAAVAEALAVRGEVGGSWS
jgi:hypothetical protein